MFQDPQTMRREAFDVNTEKERLVRSQLCAQEKAHDEAMKARVPACQGMIDRVNGRIDDETKKGNYSVVIPIGDCRDVVTHFLAKAGYTVVNRNNGVDISWGSMHNPSIFSWPSCN